MKKENPQKPTKISKVPLNYEIIYVGKVHKALKTFRCFWNAPWTIHDVVHYRLQSLYTTRLRGCDSWQMAWVGVGRDRGDISVGMNECKGEGDIGQMADASGSKWSLIFKLKGYNISIFLGYKIKMWKL